MNDTFEPTPFDDAIRRGLRASPADIPIAGLAQRAMTIASSRAQLSGRRMNHSRRYFLMTLLGIGAIATIIILGWPSLSGLFGSDQTATDATNYSMTTVGWYITWIVIAGAVSFAAIILETLSRPPSEISEQMFLAA